MEFDSFSFKTVTENYGRFRNSGYCLYIFAEIWNQKILSVARFQLVFFGNLSEVASHCYSLLIVYSCLFAKKEIYWRSIPSAINCTWYYNLFPARAEKYKLRNAKEKQAEDNKCQGRDHWKSIFVRRGLLKSEQTEHGVEWSIQEYLPITESFITSHKKLHNENCGFMGTCKPCYTRSEEKISSKKILSKIRLSKETFNFSRCSLSFSLSLFFHYSTSGVALHNKRGW